MKRGVRLRARSAKREDEADLRWELIARVKARDGHRCRAPAAFAAAGVDDPLPRCWGPLDVHELIRRAQWRAGYLVDDNCMTICRGHHEWIGANGPEAIDVGLALKSTAPRPTTEGEP